MEIRQFVLSDFNDYLHLVMQDSIYDFIMQTKPKNEKMAYDDFINYMLLEGKYAILDNNCVIGYISIEINEYHKKGVLSFVISNEFQNQHLATEAVEEILKYGFKTRHLEKIEAKVHKDNLAAIRCLINNNFQKEGLIRKEFYSKGHFIDMIHLGIVKEEYDMNVDLLIKKE